VRVVFSSTPEHSHLAPLLPLAVECRARGHEVLVACCPSLGEVAAELGLEWVPAGIDLDPDRLTASDLDLEPPPADMTPETMAAWAFGRVFVNVFARRMTPDLLAIAEGFRPDLMVRDRGEFAAWVVGERAGAPVATVTFGLPLDLERDLAYAAAELAALRESQGLGPDPELATMLMGPVLVPAPASYARGGGARPASESYVRPLVHDARPGEHLPAWIDDLGARPVVLVTLGNIFNDEGLFRTLLAAVGDEPYDVVMTVGRSVEPDALEPWPANVRVERYVPQSLLLPHVDAVMCHGGYNTVIGALAEGRPLVVAPMGADQPEHAERCDALGVGRVVPGAPLDADEVRTAIRRVLEDPSYRRSAEDLAAEIAALPDVAAAVTMLEQALI
jgi:UDP:flavonoid glycosyltransferase YjiC (YdhE family)